MFKVRRNFGILKIEFFKFSDKEKVLLSISSVVPSNLLMMFLLHPEFGSLHGWLYTKGIFVFAYHNVMTNLNLGQNDHNVLESI